tara:strand:- start:273 stop:689 length:417 start_codon:yes stop_codon:yes gene_type:complete
MKRLLLLIPLLLIAPAANAVDYLKCDAMLKAKNRLEQARETQPQADATRSRIQTFNKICADYGYTMEEIFTWLAKELKKGKNPTTADMPPSMKLAVDCETRNNEFLRQIANTAERMSKEKIEKNYRKVLLDLRSEGCF